MGLLAAINPYLKWVKIAAAVVVVVGAFAGGVRYERGQQARIELAIEEAGKSAQIATAGEIAKLKITNTTIQGKVETIIHEQKVFDQCIVPADAVGLLNDAIRGAESPRDSIVP